MMRQKLTEWDEDVISTPDEDYQAFLRGLSWRYGFGIEFVRCSPASGQDLIEKVKRDLPQKKIYVLTLLEPIDNLIQIVQSLSNHSELDVLFVVGLDKSLTKYIREGYGGQGEYYNLDTVPPILSHLNWQRENFRDRFPNLCFVFLLPQFAIKYIIRRAPDFYDWASGVFEIEDKQLNNISQTTGNLIRKNKFLSFLSSAIITALVVIALNNLPYYATLIGISGFTIFRALILRKNPKFANLGFISLLTETVKRFPVVDFIYTEYLTSKGELLDYLGRAEKAIFSSNLALQIEPDDHQSWNNRGVLLGNLGRYEEAISAYDEALQIKPDDHQSWNNRGIALFNLGRYEEAISAYDQALQIKPDDHQSWNNRGIALSNLGRNEEAINSYKQALKIQSDYQEASENLYRVLWDTGKYNEATKISKLYPKRQFDTDNKLLKAYSFINNRDYVSAIVHLYSLLEVDSDNYKALNQLGAALAKIGRQEEAIKFLDKSIQIKPDFCEAMINKGEVLQDSLEYVQALESFNKAIEVDPNLCKGWYLRGIALLKLDRWEEALASFVKTLQLDPNFHVAWKERGTALLNMQEYLEAITSFDMALQFYPADHDVWCSRGIVLMILNRYEEAIISFDKALQFQPSFLEIWSLKGQVLEKLGRIKEAHECYLKSGKYNPKSSQNQIADSSYNSSEEEAIAAYDQALQIKPDDHEAWNNRGIALVNLERYEEAIESYDRAVEIKPDFYEAWNNLSFALFSLGRYEEATLACDRVLEIKSDFHQAWNNRGIALVNLERYEEAIISYDRALEFKPDDPKSYYNKACAYSLQNQIELALENLQKAIQLNPEKYCELAKTDSDFDNICHSLRFQALIQFLTTSVTIAPFKP